MKSSEVIKILNISRPTLCNYIKSGKIKATKLGNGYYDYDDESVYKFINKPLPTSNDRINIIYCRVSTYKQKNDLSNQITDLIKYCIDNDIKYDKIFHEIASGIDFERKQFSEVINLVISNKVSNIYITYKDRLSRLSFMTLEKIFKSFNTNIIVINDNHKFTNLDSDLFDELISILHLFSTKMYSKRSKHKLSKCKHELQKID